MKLLLDGFAEYNPMKLCDTDIVNAFIANQSPT